MGMWRAGMDGTDINSCCRTPDADATADDELLDAVAEIGPLTDDVAEGLARKTPQADVAKVQLVDRCLL